MLKDLTKSINGRSSQPLIRENERSLNEKSCQALAQDLLTAWQQAHGASSGAASAWLGPNSVTILIEEAFCQAELTLARRPDGQALLRRYTEHLMDQLGPKLADHIEETLGRRVVSTNIHANPEADSVVFMFKLGEMLPRHPKAAPR